MSHVALRAVVSGRVQGVGFRAHTRQQALALGLHGSAVNLPDGRVEIEAEGERSACESLLGWLQGGEPPGSVSDVDVEWTSPTGASGFTTR